MSTEANAQYQQNATADQEGGEEQLDPEAMEALRAAMSPADKQYATQKNVPRRIHILGTGSVGKLVAHSLRGIPDPPPVTLIFYRYQVLQAWERSKKVITVQDGDFTIPRGGFDVELKPEARRQHGMILEEGSPDVFTLSEETGMKPHEIAKIVAGQQQNSAQQKLVEKAIAESTPVETPDQPAGKGDYAISNEPIHSLIVCTKTLRTVLALATLKHRITKDSTICFLQNGMGVIDDVNKHIFPDESKRPQYLQGVVTHGAHVPLEKAIEDPFFVVHAGHGTIAVGAVPAKPPSATSSKDERPRPSTDSETENSSQLDEAQINELQPTARYITRTLIRTPVLACVAFTPIELLQLQLEKLAINSVLGPLTCLLDCRNGTFLYNFALTRVTRLLLAETSLIIRSLPEIRGLPNLHNRFSAERLETLVVSVANKTRDNISSMLADVRRGMRTEVEYINGYIIKRGEELGIKAVVNYSLMQVVNGKAMMTKREFENEVPIEGQGRKADVGGE